MRPVLTIILVTPERVVRADFKGGGPSMSLHALKTMAEASDDILGAVETGLFILPNVARRVWVLATDVWTQVVRLPVRSVAGLKAGQLAASLGYESEALSGIAAAQSQVGFHQLKGNDRDRRYWISQFDRTTIAHIAESVRRYRARFMGVAHPASIGANSKPVVELWPGTLVGAQEGEVEVVSADPRTSSVTEALGSWLSGRPLEAMERWTFSGAHLPDTDGLVWRDLSTEPDLREWLERGARKLSQSTAPVPMLSAPKKPVSARGRLITTLAACAAALVVCAAHFFLVESDREHWGRVLQERQNLQKQAAMARKSADDTAAKERMAAQKVKELSEQAALRDATRQAHRTRWAKLLPVLSRHAPKDLMIKGISARNYDVTLSGVCLRPELANELASKLGEHLAGLGWRVQPPQKQRMGLAADGGPWSFDLTLTDAPVPPAPAAAGDSAKEVKR